MFQDITDQDATGSTAQCGFFLFNNKEVTIATKLLTDSFQRRTSHADLHRLWKYRSMSQTVLIGTSVNGTVKPRE